MESYCEYLTKKRLEAKNYLLIVLIWLAAFALVYGVIWLSALILFVKTFAVIIIAGILYGAFRLVQLMDIEYEMIAVNRDLDIDKIIAKRSRKRMLTVHLDKIEEYGKYSENVAARLANRSFEFKINCANQGDDAAYMVYRHPKKGLCFVVIPVNEKLEKEILKSVPKMVISK